MDLARIRVLRTLINSSAKNLHKLQFCLRFYSFYKFIEKNGQNLESPISFHPINCTIYPVSNNDAPSKNYLNKKKHPTRGARIIRDDH